MQLCRSLPSVLRATTLFAALVLSVRQPALAQAAQAQSARVRAPTDSLIRAALETASAGDTSAALELLERATDQSPRDPDALYWRGLMLSRATALSLMDTPRRVLASYLLNRANDIDPRNPRYLIEIGRIRLKTPLLRVEAERMFRRALSIAESNGDPAQLAEVAYELGQIKQRRYLSSRDRYIYTSPNVIFDPIAARSQLHYTREFLENLSQPIENSAQVDRLEAEEYFRRALSALPTHAPSGIALMGLLYDQQRYNEMLRVAQPYATVDTAPARILFAAGLAAYRAGTLRVADSLFGRALARFSSAERSEITSIGRIARINDSVSIDALTPAERERTERAFWEAADPLLATPENEARLEYLARAAFADLRFSDSDTRQVGWRTDRGLIVARYGEPPIVATFAPTSDADAKDAVGRVITVWFYPRTEVEFVFTGPPAMNIAFFAGNHRGFAEEQRERAPFLLDNLPLALGVDTIPIQLVRFRGATPARNELLVAASMPIDRLYRAAEIDQGRLEQSLWLGPLANMTLARRDTATITLPSTQRTGRVWLEQLDAGANVRLRVEARDAALLGAAARAQVELNMMSTESSALTTSDLLIANRQASIVMPTGGALDRVPGRWREIGLVPRGDLVLAQRDTFAVYWETYGLEPNAEGRVAYDVRLIITLEQIEREGSVRRFFGGLTDIVGVSPEGDQQLGLRFARSDMLGGRDRIPEVVTLGLGSAPSGRYRLELVITEKVSGRTTRTRRQFFIRG
ncbi:MAG: GWxTD domain-containing protein [Gemmatimonadaceae bacterium]|nr:GWxTD domain-containing protein [Gemmatimonadaceae bacterium]